MNWLRAAVLSTAAVSTVALAGLAYELSRPPRPAGPFAIEKIPASRRDPNPWARWTVTEQLAAHHVLIVQVETRHLNEARAIARTIIDPILPKEHYAEILIYFHRPGRPDVLPPRRVQWTPNSGYVERVFE